MIFTDAIFVLHFLVFILLHNIVFRDRFTLRKGLVVVFGVYLMASFGTRDALLFGISAGTNYVALFVMDRFAPKKWKHGILWCVVTSNLLFLIAVKSSLPGFFLKFEPSVDAAYLLLPPVAISFYTFHIISVAVDVFRGRINRPSFIDYLWYLALFPHLLAGPIVRGWELIPQIRRKLIARVHLPRAVYLFFLGAFLKVVVADTIGVAIDPYWDGTKLNSASLLDLWLVCLLYYCQIYGDFAGYSLMAIGMAWGLGIRLPPNFAGPMTAVSFRDFWRRWHITLSRWLRDYLYIPLGGSFHGLNNTIRNLMVTMLLGGLWHGVDFGFVIWGAIHGIGLSIEHFLLRRGISLNGGYSRIVGFIITQLLVLVAWVFFRAPDLSYALKFLLGMFTPSRLHLNEGWIGSDLAILLPLVLAALIHNFYRHPMERSILVHPMTLGTVSAFFFVSLVWVSTHNAPFMYFRF